jgi:ferredoxin
MRTRVDKAACCGYALCVEICPEVYRLGGDAIVEILLDPVPPELADKVRRAVEECPQSALTAED